MRELGVTGLSEDGHFLVAHDPQTDESFHIAADATLRSLLSVDVPAAQPDREAGTREPKMETTLSPREIQNRVRRGASAEEVAEESGMPLEKVEGFAVPVIAEREYVAEQARKTAVRRLTSGSGPGMLLGTLVDESVASQGVSPEATVWDAWRREDGRWTIDVAPDGFIPPATFLFDVKGRYVLPADDAAHELIGDVAMQQAPEMDLVNAVREDEVVAAPAATEPVAEQAPLIEEILDVVETTEVLQAYVPEDYLENPAPVSSLKEARDRRALEQLAMSLGPEDEGPREVADVEITEEHDFAVPDTARPAKKKHERRRVPSWDEIMFGGHPD